jgi:hypothetical protein
MIDRTGQLGTEELNRLWQMGLIETQEIVEIMVERRLAKEPGVRLVQVQVDRWQDLPFNTDHESNEIRIIVKVKASTRPAKDFWKQWICPGDNLTFLIISTNQAIETLLQEIGRAEKWPG